MKSNLLQGVGIGLRPCHYSFIETKKPPVPFFEILADNYLSLSGPNLFHLEKICQHYPVTLHCVGMSLGSSDPLNFNYLNKLKALMKFTQPQLISDHLSWTSLNNRYFHELFPLPYTEEAVTHTAKRIQRVQDFLGQRIMIENVSSYLNYQHSVMTEWEFLQAVADTADCWILLDINNIYVSAYNNHFIATDYIAKLFSQRIKQFHLAGFSDHDNYLLDTHSSSITDPVWELYQQGLTAFGPIPTVIERDNDIPNFQTLLNEAQHAEKLMERYAITC